MKINEFQLEYQINNDERKIRIFGSTFVHTNSNKCKIVVNNKRIDLREFLDLGDYVKFPIINAESNKIKIRLLTFTKITDFTKMCCDCKSLLRFNVVSLNISKEIIAQNKNYNNFNSVSHYEDLLLNIYYPLLDLKDFNKIDRMESIFSNCESLIDLSVLSYFNTSSVKSFYNLFNECSSVITIPDISK